MTVSCNCNDADGSGFIGDLDELDFPRVFSGPIARRFREELAAGRLPTPRCAVCQELSLVSPIEAEARIHDFELPKGLMLENTSVCNLVCTSCDRDQLRKTRRRTRLREADVARVADLLRELDATSLHYYKLGEPFASSTVRSELAIIREKNPEIFISLSTNGALIDSDEKREAGLLLDEIIFSIDGIDTEMVRRYQKGGDFQAAYENMKALAALRRERKIERPVICWRYVLFRWNDRRSHLERALELARDAGVDGFEVVFAKTPLSGISWRRFLSPFHRSLGERTGLWTRRVDFGQDSLQPGGEAAPVLATPAMLARCQGAAAPRPANPEVPDEPED